MRKWHFLLALITTLLVGIGSTVSAHPWWNDRLIPQFEFALIGDLPYDSNQEAKFTNLINDIPDLNCHPLTPPARVTMGYNDFLVALEVETLAFGKPVVLVHGDTHSFQINKPLFGSKSERRIENFTRVETFGSPDVHWLRASVDFKNPNVFNFQQQIVKENLVAHQL